MYNVEIKVVSKLKRYFFSVIFCVMVSSNAYFCAKRTSKLGERYIRRYDFFLKIQLLL